MKCDESRTLLEAHADGELDLLHQMEMEAHLRACPDCARRAGVLAARRAALGSSLPRFQAPPGLRESVLASVRGGARPAARRGASVLRPIWNLGGMAASLAAALVFGYAWGSMRARTDSVLHEAVADHVRSLQAGHLMDVVSTDQHTVKPWFIGRLDFSPPVVDLADRGFPLVGGRLDRLDGQTAAAIVFRRRLHTINVFIWPAARGAVPAGTAGESGYSVESWSQGGLNFLAVSEIPASELGQFVGEYRRAAGIGPPPASY